MVTETRTIRPPLKQQREPISVLQADDLIVISLTGHRIDEIGQWAGTVIEADSVGIKIEASWYRIGLSPVSSSGVRVVPWRQVRDVAVKGRAS